MTQHCGFFYLQKRYICCFSGLMINRNKTEILWIGKLLHRKDTVENIKHDVRGKIVWKAFFLCFPSTLLPERIYLDTLVSCLVFSEKKEQYDVIEINYSNEHSLQKY